VHLPDGVVLSTDESGKTWRTAVEVELTRKTEARVAAILGQLLKTYDDVVYKAAPGAATVVQRAAVALPVAAEAADRLGRRLEETSGRSGVTRGLRAHPPVCAGFRRRGDAPR
jgi:hypothetical protein